MPTPAAEDYLKAIYKESRTGDAAGTSALAQALGVSPASVSGMLRRLAGRGLIEHEPYYGARLTEAGRAAALGTIRRHRVLEAFLVEVLGYSWDSVHEEAERLEHAASDELVNRMAAALGDPAEDPHGAPIPAYGGEVVDPRWPLLADFEPGETGVVRRVVDESPEALRYLGKIDLRPGARVTVVDRISFGGPMTVHINGTERMLPETICAHVRVERTGKEAKDEVEHV